MPSYVIVGASRGIGYAFLQILSKDPSNIVVGIVRNLGPTQEKLNADNLTNRVTLLEADLTDIKSLRAAAAEVSKLANGKLDYLINSGGFISTKTVTRFLSDFEGDDYQLLVDDMQTAWDVNVIGVINSINAFLPLVLKSDIKKVISLSSGMADPKLIKELDLWESAPYTISKMALNGAVAKYSARYRSQGVLFLAISPGSVQTDGAYQPDDSEVPAKFGKYAPDFKGNITPHESVNAILKVIGEANVKEHGGDFVSHLGVDNPRWL